MTDVIINYWAVLACGVASQVLGMIWYSPMLFGKQWMALMGIKAETPEEIKKMKQKARPAYIASFIASLIMAYVLAHFVQYAGAYSIADGMQAGFWIWLGFVGTIGFTNAMFDGKPIKLVVINTGYFLATLLVMGAILAVWI